MPIYAPTGFLDVRNAILQEVDRQLQDTKTQLDALENP